MIDKIFDLLKLFLEKFLVPTLLAVVLTFLTYFKTPENFAMIIKFSLTGYVAFVFCGYFLIIKLCQVVGVKLFLVIKNIIQTKRREKKEQMQLREQVKSQLSETINKFHKATNKLSPEDRKLLREFYNTNNEPIKRSTKNFYGRTTLLGSDWVESSVVKGDKKQPINICYDNSDSDFIPIDAYETVYGEKAYWLKDDVYDILKQSIDITGKVSDID